MSGDAEQEYFSEGITEDIITNLSHNHSFFVISRSASFTYKGPAVDVGKVGRELGVRYVLEGRKEYARSSPTHVTLKPATTLALRVARWRDR